MNSFTLESKTQHTIAAVSTLAFISLLADGWKDGEGVRNGETGVVESVMARKVARKRARM